MKNKKYGWVIGGILLGLVAICLIFIAFWPTIFEQIEMDWQGPDSGLWYCEELEIQLCFQSEYIDNKSEQKNTYSYALINGKPIMCRVFNYEGSYTLRVDNQDASAGDDLGKNIFKGEFVSLDAQNYVVQNDAGDVFTFKRVAEFSFEDESRCYQKEIGSYNGVQAVGEVRHIAIAIQKAEELWKTELGIDTIDNENVVAYDFAYNCWRVSTISESSPICLVDTKGNVIGVWGQGVGSPVSCGGIGVSALFERI